MATSHPRNEAFLDASYAIALALRSDQHHEVALRLSFEIESARRPLVTTRAVLFEIGNGLSRFRLRPTAITLLKALESDPTVETIPLTNELYRQALNLFEARSDKDWGLTDCLSFVVMSDRGISDALTHDAHFEQAGFRALMRQAI